MFLFVFVCLFVCLGGEEMAATSVDIFIIVSSIFLLFLP